jgi:hypothetical protein
MRVFIIVITMRRASNKAIIIASKRLTSQSRIKIA